MKPGDTIESSIWLAGTETAEDRARYERDVRESIDELCDQKGFIHGPVTFTELNPGDHRVPKVPDHIHGPAVRLLVAEADVLLYRPHRSTAAVRKAVGRLH